MKRILHFTPGFRLGGVETLLLGFYRNLDRERFQFDFVTDNTDDQAEFDEIRSNGGRVHQLGRYMENPLRYQRAFNSVLAGMRPQDTIFHAHDPLRTLPLLLSAKRHGIFQRIVHSHTDSYMGARRRHVVPLIKPLSARLATRRFACSHAAGRFMFGKRDFVVLRNAINLPVFAFDPAKRAAIRSRYGIAANATVVGHTGRFTFQKNHSWVVEVFAQFARLRPDAHLLLLGAGPLEDETREQVARHCLGEAVTFAGKQSDVASFLSAMDLFVMPSHFEGLGISLLEAQASGLPCLASDIVAPEVLATDAMRTLSLSRPALDWAAELVELENGGRLPSSEQVAKLREMGYDIHEETQRLMRLYLGRE